MLLPDIEEEANRMMRDAPKLKDGNYLWFDAWASVATGIDEERGRHADMRQEVENLTDLLDSLGF